MQEVETKLGAVKRVFLEARGETGGDGTKLKACSPCCVRLSARYSASVGGGGSSMRWGGVGVPCSLVTVCRLGRCTSAAWGNEGDSSFEGKP
jgi:hypothetical protein